MQTLCQANCACLTLMNSSIGFGRVAGSSFLMKKWSPSASESGQCEFCFLVDQVAGGFQLFLVVACIKALLEPLPEE